MKKRRQIKTKPFNAPTSEAKRIIREISTLVRRMSTEYISKSNNLSAEILEQLQRKYQELFNVNSQIWANRLSDSALKSANHQFNTSLKELSQEFAISSFTMSDDMRKTFKMATDEHAALFKTIPEQFHKQVSSVVFNAITSGEGAKDITRYIKKFDNGTHNYVSLRTMDQTRKAFSALSRQRMIDAGIKKFKWIHTSGSAEPRKLHLDLNGKVFDIDSPPYIGDMYNERIYGFPSQLPNCRCRQAFVLAEG